MPIANHVGDTRVFQHATVVLHERVRHLIQRVAATVGNVFLLALDSQQRFAIVLRATLSPRQLVLQNVQPALGNPIVVRVLDFHPIGEGCQRRYSNVHADALSCRWQRGIIQSLSRQIRRTSSPPDTRFEPS
jgi:hypothetical protein